MEQYEVLSHIGKGSFGVVSKIRRKADGKILVWKELNYGKMSEKEKQQLVAEVNILRDLSHPQIVQYYDRIIDKKTTKIYIIMEYCEKGDMGTLLKRCKKDRDYIAEDVIWKIFTQIVQALSECHNRKQGKILHRDLKPANIFLDSDNNIKLGDFGLSRVMDNQSMFAYTHVGTPYYMSPEQINELKYNERSDIWSAGCLLYEIAALRPPFEATNHLSLAIKIKSGKFERIPQRYSEALQKVIAAMLNADSDRRPSANDLLKIPQLDMRIKEKKLRDKLLQVKQIEEDIKKKEDELKKMQSNLLAREKKLELAESKLMDSEKQIGQKDQENKAVPTVEVNIKTTKERFYHPPPMRLNHRAGSCKDSSYEARNTTMEVRSSSKIPRDHSNDRKSLTIHPKNVNKSFTIGNYKASASKRF